MFPVIYLMCIKVVFLRLNDCGTASYPTIALAAHLLDAMSGGVTTP